MCPLLLCVEAEPFVRSVLDRRVAASVARAMQQHPQEPPVLQAAAFAITALASHSGTCVCVRRLRSITKGRHRKWHN